MSLKCVNVNQHTLMKLCCGLFWQPRSDAKRTPASQCLHIFMLPGLLVAGNPRGSCPILPHLAAQSNFQCLEASFSLFDLINYLMNMVYEVDWDKLRWIGKATNIQYSGSIDVVLTHILYNLIIPPWTTYSSTYPPILQEKQHVARDSNSDVGTDSWAAMIVVILWWYCDVR